MTKVMWSNVEKVVNRGARLDDLETRSQNLQEATIQFQVGRNNPDCNGAQSAVDGVKGPGCLAAAFFSNQNLDL